MTLPPRVPVPAVTVDLDAADAIVCRARRRRRSQLGGAAGFVAASLVAIAALGPSAGTAGLDPVDPAVAPSGAPAGGDGGGGADPRLAPGVPGPAAPDAAPAGRAGVAPGRPAAPGEPDATAPDSRKPRPQARASVRREVVANRVTEPCQTTYTHVLDGDPADAAHLCLRYSWPATVARGAAVPFVVEYCALDRDVPATWQERPNVAVESPMYEWKLPAGRVAEETLRMNTCWRWTIRWNAVGYRTRGSTPVTMPAGTYTVDVQQPYGNRFAVYSTHPAPNRPTELRIR